MVQQLKLEVVHAHFQELDVCPTTPGALSKLLDTYKLPVSPVVLEGLRSVGLPPSVLDMLEVHDDGLGRLMDSVFHDPDPNINETSEQLVACFVHAQMSPFLTATGFLCHRNVSGPVAAKAPRFSPANVSVMQGGARLDFCAHTRQGLHLVFFGEEKAFQAGLARAKADLLDVNRIVWSPLNFGDAPFLVAYAASGSKIQLFAFCPDGNQGKTRLEPLWGQLDLSKLGDRVKLRVQLGLVVRALMAIVRDHFPTEPVPVTGRNIHVCAGYIDKIIQDKDSAPRGDLDKLYAQLAKDKPPCLVLGSMSGSMPGSTRPPVVQLRPVGFLRPPESFAELRGFIKCAMRGLHWLHTEAKFVHRDVRTPNVLRLPESPRTAEGSWMLTDYESGHALAPDGTAPWHDDTFNKENLPSLEPTLDALERKRWTPAHDIQQAREMLLVRDMPLINLNPDEMLALEEFKTQMEGCKTAAAVLELVWLKRNVGTAYVVGEKGGLGLAGARHVPDDVAGAPCLAVDFVDQYEDAWNRLGLIKVILDKTTPKSPQRVERLEGAKDARLTDYLRDACVLPYLLGQRCTVPPRT